jgi:HPt (histidine-containing phosphotransfer) domain-containing protein
MSEAMDKTLDVAALMDRLGGDRELLQELIALYLEDEPGLLAQIATAIREAQPDAIRRAAHTLKGSVGIFCASSAQAAAAAMEAAGRDGKLDAAATLHEHLVAEFDRVRDALRALAAG